VERLIWFVRPRVISSYLDSNILLNWPTLLSGTLGFKAFLEDVSRSCWGRRRLQFEHWPELGSDVAYCVWYCPLGSLNQLSRAGLLVVYRWQNMLSSSRALRGESRTRWVVCNKIQYEVDIFAVNVKGFRLRKCGGRRVACLNVCCSRCWTRVPRFVLKDMISCFNE
jgi:hypothetical protein